MMVKKKLTETEENKKKNHTEITENKDNKHNTDPDNKDQVELSHDKESVESQLNGDGIAEPATDKVVREENVFEAKLAEIQDKYLRLSAEFDNYRKRTLREKMDIAKYAGEDILIKVLPFMDDFERALKHMESTTDSVALKEGIDLIYVKFYDFLTQNGVKEIESLNSRFDVDLHEAVAQVPVEEETKKGKVVDVILKGYYLQDKVIRHSKVVVGE